VVLYCDFGYVSYSYVCVLNNLVIILVSSLTYVNMADFFFVLYWM
jgi:hypothetical protein